MWANPDTGTQPFTSFDQLVPTSSGTMQPGQPLQQAAQLEGGDQQSKRRGRLPDLRALKEFQNELKHRTPNHVRRGSGAEAAAKSSNSKAYKAICRVELLESACLGPRMSNQ